MTPDPPEKLSDALEMAIADGRRIDRSAHRATSDHWHFSRGVVAWVNMSGMMMAGRLKVESHQTRYPGAFPSAWRNVLEAVAHAVDADYWKALTLMGIEPLRGINNESAIEGPENSDYQTWEEWDSLAKELEWVVSQLREYDL